MKKISKICPECGHQFRGNGWDGIDAHWRSKHAQVMSYQEAWTLISADNYQPKRQPREDLNWAAEQIVRGATERD